MRTGKPRSKVYEVFTGHLPLLITLPRVRVKELSTGLALVLQGQDVRAAAVPRHVCAEGCQLVVRHADVRAGQRLRFRLEGARAVAGTVRWVVGDRAGFAFDRPLSRDDASVLLRHGRDLPGLALYPA